MENDENLVDLMGFSFRNMIYMINSPLPQAKRCRSCRKPADHSLRLDHLSTES